jgi:hypothetical protein
MRTWSSPFGPLGTPLLDRDDPAGVVTDFFEMLSRPHLKLPKVHVLPDMRLDGPVARMLKAVAETRGLPIETTSLLERPFLESDLDGETYLKTSLRAHHYREFRSYEASSRRKRPAWPTLGRPPLTKPMPRSRRALC